MNAPANLPRILLIDTNVYFSKRLTDELKEQGFEVVPCNQVAYALTMLEWNTPMAILCATNLREMGALEMAPILRGDPKTAAIPLVAIGSGGDQALLEAYRAGCDDYVDRRRAPADIAAHVRNFLVSRQEGFQPTQMLTLSDTALSGSLSHLDLPGIMQMLGQARQTGALHINAGDTDGVIFFEAGEILHAECAAFFGDEAVIQIVKACQGAGKGVYKFVYGASGAQRTVLRSSTDLLLDALREFDEAQFNEDPGVTAQPGELAPDHTGHAAPENTESDHAEHDHAEKESS
jgi:CheY-like chemotaxis protein